MEEEEFSKLYCEKEKRDIFENECDKWSCPHWVGNGGICVPTRALKEVEEE